MSNSPTIVIDSDADNEMSSLEVNVSSNSVDTSSPLRLMGRHRNYIWSHFIDEGEAKTGGYRKARCRYCMILLNYVKIPLMYSHIANQCDIVLEVNPSARLDAIAKFSENDQQNHSPKTTKRVLQVRYVFFHHLKFSTSILSS